MQYAAEEEIKNCEERCAQKIGEIESVSDELQRDLQGERSKVRFSNSNPYIS